MKLGPGHDNKVIGYEVRHPSGYTEIVTPDRLDEFHPSVWSIVRSVTEEDDAVIADGALAAQADMLGWDPGKWKRDYRAEV